MEPVEWTGGALKASGGDALLSSYYIHYASFIEVKSAVCTGLGDGVPRILRRVANSKCSIVTGFLTGRSE